MHATRVNAVIAMAGPLFIVVSAMGTAAAQTPESTAALKARISSLPAAAVEIKKPDADARSSPARAPTEWKVGPVETMAHGSTGTSGANFKARYVELPPQDWRDAKIVLEQQLSSLKPARPDLPAFVPFTGAVVTQTAGAAEVTLIPLVTVDDPLRFNASSNRFEGRIAVGLVEPGFKGPPKALPAAFRFQAFGDATTVPEVADVATTSPPFTAILVFATDPRDSVELQVFSNLSTKPVVLSLPVERARLFLRAKKNLQGWGLESADVTVSASDGPASKGQVVVLEAPLGNLTPEQVRLGDDGTAIASLRSESIGVVDVTASSARLSPAKERFNFEFPLRFLLSAVVGGIAGGLLRRGLKRGGLKSLLSDLLLGVVAGALIFGLYALGVNVTGFQLPRSGGELLVAVVAALGAFGGTRLLEPKPPPL
jgi:hypothetical protein